MFKFETGKITEITIPANGISYNGVCEINNMLSQWGLPLPPSDWDWSWKVNGKGPFVGTLPKRLSKFYYKENRTKLTQDQMSLIGSVASANSERNSRYFVDFDKDMEWEAGDFSDGGSCFWTCRAMAKTMLRDNDGYTVRFFCDLQGNRGIGRAIVRPYQNYFVVFNSYGLDLLDVARVLATHLGLSYHKVRLHNEGVCCGTLWINGERGFIVGEEKHIKNISECDVGWEDEWKCCSSCGCEVCDSEWQLIDGEIHCQRCFDRQNLECCDCGEYVYGEEYSVIDERIVCRHCISDNYTTCQHCGLYTHVDNAIPDEVTEHLYCESCVERYYNECMGCATFVIRSRGSVCPRCISDGTVTSCEECDDLVLSRDTKDGLCIDCKKEADNEHEKAQEASV